MLNIGQAVRSFDFDLNDDRGFHYDGIITGYAQCVTQYTEDGEPYQGFKDAPATTDCPHYVIEVLVMGYGHGAHTATKPATIYAEVSPMFGGTLVVPLDENTNVTVVELRAFVDAVLTRGGSAKMFG